MNRKLRRALERHFPDLAITRLTTAVDLEKSFARSTPGDSCARASRLSRFWGVNASETQASIDASLTFGILWLVPPLLSASSFRRGSPHVSRTAVPRSSASVWQIFWNRAAAKWSLFELDERHDALVEVDCTDRGNVATRLVHATNETAARERFADSIARINTILPNCEVAVLSAAELAFRWRGLEFARARMGAEAATFRSKVREIVFGVGAEERARKSATGHSSCNCLPPSATLAIPTGHANTRCSDCARNAGWNRSCG